MEVLNRCVGIEDMIKLDDLTEETLLQNLLIRYNSEIIYTYVGNILVSMNPYKSLLIYTTHVANLYNNKRIGTLAPHIFAIADSAYRQVLINNKNQSILISGESGAGKTESTKLILQYLSTLTQSHNEIEQMILETSPILESFGNAKTVRNNNSSRFGKFMQIHFDQSGFIVGASVVQYLLEKTRITQQSESERSYHIFYQFCKGSSVEEKKSFKIYDINKFEYLNKSGCIDVADIDDIEDFQRVKMALSFLKIPLTIQISIWKLLSAILHLGNIQFSKLDRGEGSHIVNLEELNIVAELLSVNSEELKKGLTSRLNIIQREKIIIPLKPNEAVESRNSLARELYGQLFQWLVSYLNSKIFQTNKVNAFIGVLDIFGFENFPLNSFEQFCINYANEKLQQFFNQHIFKVEQEAYQSEGIKWEQISFVDNQECLDLIEKKLGIIDLINEESRFPKATDLTLLDKLNTQHIKHPYYIKPKTAKNSFIIKHYAGEVSYDITSFLDKNRDNLPIDLVSIIEKSENSFISKLFKQEETSEHSQKKTAKLTTAAQFKIQLASLVSTLTETEPFYVRCIKPNSLKKSNLFDNELVLAQLKYSGMLETVKIRKLGFPIRFSFTDFLRRFRVISPKENHSDKIWNILNLLNKIELNPTEWQLGTSKVFLREKEVAKLEDVRSAAVTAYAILIQKTWRMFWVRRYYLEVREAATKIASHTKGYFARKRYLLKRDSAITIQSFAKKCFTRKNFLSLKKASIQFQTAIRSFQERKTFLLKKNLAFLVQIMARGFLSRKAYLIQRDEKIREEARKREEQRQKEEAERKRREEQRQKEEAERKKREDLEKKRLEEEEKKRKEQEEAAELQRLKEEEENQQKLLQEYGTSGSPTFLRMKESNSKESSPIFGRSFKSNSSVNPFSLDEYNRLLRDLLVEVNFDNSNSPSSSTNSSPPSSPTPYSIESIAEVINLKEEATKEELTQQEKLESRIIEIKSKSGQRTYPTLKFSKKRKSFSLNLGIEPIIESPKLVSSEEEAAHFDLNNYASENFQVHRTGTIRKKIVWGKHLFKYSKKPISTSLHYLDAENTKLSTLLFGKINDYLEEKPDEITNVKFILQKGLELDVIRDEIFCLIIKQITENPKPEQILRGWYLLSFCISTFPPTKKFSRYLASYFFVQSIKCKEISEQAKFCSQRLTRLLSCKKIRKFIPSSTELVAAQNHSPIVCRFHYADNQKKALYIDSVTSVKEAFTQLVEKIGISDPSGFSIFEVYNSVERALKPDEFLADALSKYERFEKEVKSKNPNFQLTFMLAFKCRLFFTPRELFAEETYNILLFYQAAKEIFEGKLPCSPTDLIKLAGIKMQIDWGDYNPKRTYNKDIPSLYIPQKSLSQRPLREWETAIVDEYMDLSGKSKEEAIHIYLSYVKQLPFYGTTFFSVSHSLQNSSIPSQFELGINIDGIHFIDPMTKTKLQTRTYSELESYLHSEKNITLHFKKHLSLPPMEIKSIQSADISSFITDYSSYLMKESEYARALMDYDVSAPSLLNFKKGDIIKIIERNDNEWFTGEIGKSRGQFPVDHVQLLLSKPTLEEITIKEEEELKAVDEVQSKVLSVFAYQKFRTETLRKGGTLRLGGSGRRSRKTLDISKRVSFTKDPLKESLLNLDESLNSTATNLFLSIMKFMQDYPREKKKTEYQIAQEIIQTGIDIPQVRDEIYCQLCKQTSNHPKLNGLIKGWELIALCSGCFTPSSEFKNYLMNYLQNSINSSNVDISKYAVYALTTLNKISKAGRRYAPSTEEFTNVLNRATASMQPIYCRIFMLDGTSKAIFIDPASTIQFATNQIVSKIDLKDSEGFEICEGGIGYDVGLKPEANLCDIMASWEFKKEKPKFIFKKRFFKQRTKHITDPIELNLIYHQACYEVLTSQLVVTQEMAIELAAYQIQINHGDSQKDKQFLTSSTLQHFVPKKLIPQQSPEDWIQVLLRAHMHLKGLSQEDAKLMYLDRLAAHPLYASSMFPCEQLRYPNKIWLFLSTDGIKITEEFSKNVLDSWKYDDISHWSPSDDTFGILAGSLQKPERRVFVSPQAQEIANTFQYYFKLASEKKQGKEGTGIKPKERPRRRAAF